MQTDRKGPAQNQSPTQAMPAIETDDRDGLIKEGAGRPGRKTLWVVQGGTGNAPVFAFVLAGYGDAWAAKELGRGLGPDNALLALQPPDDEAAFAAVSNAPDLAALYVHSLRTLRPGGPYFLGGYSAGAILAMEMARLLKEQGQEVGLLALLDPLFLHYSRLERFGYGALKRMVKMLEPFTKGNTLFGIWSAMIQDQGLERHLRALQNYEPQPYPGRIQLIEARGSVFLRPPGFIASWKKIAQGGLERHHPRGDHHTFLRPPHVGKLGKQLCAWIGQYLESRNG